MFETTKPSQSAFAPGILPAGSDDSFADESWRVMGWSELAARINAARDLRIALKSERPSNMAADHAGDLDCEGKRAVNPDALEGRKASAFIQSEYRGEMARGATEIQND